MPNTPFVNCFHIFQMKCLAKVQPLRIPNQQKSLNLIKKWPRNGQMKLCSTLGAGEVFENQPKGKAKLSTQISSIKITKIPWYRLPTKYQYLKISSSNSQWWILHEIPKFIQKLHTWSGGAGEQMATQSLWESN